MKCFYHSADLDGKCSAAIVQYFNPEAELIGYNYGNEFPWGTIVQGEKVYMVDVSLQPLEKMKELNAMCDLIWIDHHKSAIEARLSIQGMQRVGIGACALVWEWFSGDSKIPYGVELLAKYDVWDHSDPRTLPFQYGIRLLDIKPDDKETWEELFKDTVWVHLQAGNGQSILKYIQQDYAARTKILAFETKLDGLTFITANHALGNSQFFDSIWDEERYDAMCLFYWKKTFWSVHLYSTKESIDLSQVALKRGGGGHKGAAGFQCDELPFALEPRLGVF